MYLYRVLYFYYSGDYSGHNFIDDDAKEIIVLLQRARYFVLTNVIRSGWCQNECTCVSDHYRNCPGPTCSKHG